MTPTTTGPNHPTKIWPASTPKSWATTRRRDDSFFDLGGDSILSIQVVAGPRCRSAVTAARCFRRADRGRLARVLGWQRWSMGGRRGHWAVGGHPIMRWLRSLGGAVEQFNQTMVVQAPVGSPTPTSWWCCRRCWTGTRCWGTGR
ncbi:linear gramicidin synthetase subunit D domain protein [Mycobacterium xenopi 4042]|uniref:Linear gramicidin synthetase subunit D domain protein n=1 Tax=Mycobacterium xenopi 4042 TaxID=1299334 RepID=X8E5I1_MYCXE|nr:linear gramicidin synthetase subunit D domain protein [Mycobacterium xenopi 4042]